MQQPGKPEKVTKKSEWETTLKEGQDKTRQASSSQAGRWKQLQAADNKTSCTKMRKLFKRWVTAEDLEM